MKKSLLVLAVVAASGAAFAAGTAKDTGIVPFAKPIGQKPEAKDQKAQAVKLSDIRGITKLSADKPAALQGMVSGQKLTKNQAQPRGERVS